MNDLLFHCFGSLSSHRVDTATAVSMLRSSGTQYLAINTHNMDVHNHWKDFTIGYGDASYRSVMEHFSPDELTPVLNINLPTSAQEAVERTQKAHEPSGINIIKLEVLSPDHLLVVNAEVLAAVKTLSKNSDLDIWPLMTPDLNLFKNYVDLGCTMIRVMGSPIGSRKGIDPAWKPIIEQMIAYCPDSVKMMLDGGVGSGSDVENGIKMGFDCVLVNSCLFKEPFTPAEDLAKFREIAMTTHAAMADAD